jgi:hypothetical protein
MSRRDDGVVSPMQTDLDNFVSGASELRRDPEVMAEPDPVLGSSALHARC